MAIVSTAHRRQLSTANQSSSRKLSSGQPLKSPFQCRCDRIPADLFVAQRNSEIAMSRLLRFSGAVKRDSAIEGWMHDHSGELGAIAQQWFAVMRDCGDDVRELLHDGHPTACVEDAAFGYVNAFKSHVNVGFFRGAEIAVHEVSFVHPYGANLHEIGRKPLAADD